MDLRREHEQAAEQQEVLQQLSDWAERHVAESEGRLVLLPIDPETYPAQTTHIVEGAPMGAAIVEGIATEAVPLFPKIRDKAKEIEEQSQEFSRIAELIKGGNNVVIITNHGELIDIAVALAAVYCEIEKDDFKPTTAIIISKMVAMLGYNINGNTAVATDVLKLVCNYILQSFPRTESVKRSRFGDLLARFTDRHNEDVNSELAEILEAGHSLVAISPSGTTDKPSDDDPNTYILAPVKDGTAAILTSDKTYVVPIAVWLDGEEPVFEMCDIPRKLTKKEEVDEAMVKIAAKLQEKVPEKKFKYIPAVKSVGKTALSGSDK